MVEEGIRMIRLLSRFLYLANAGRREAFYPTKDLILKLFAKPCGYDLQLFPCWGCDDCAGQGWSDSWDTCGGSGTHHGFILDRYRLGGRIFHRPRPMCQPQFDGQPFLVQYPRHSAPACCRVVDVRLRPGSRPRMEVGARLTDRIGTARARLRSRLRIRRIHRLGRWARRSVR